MPVLQLRDVIDEAHRREAQRQAIRIVRSGELLAIEAEVLLLEWINEARARHGLPPLERPLFETEM